MVVERSSGGVYVVGYPLSGVGQFSCVGVAEALGIDACDCVHVDPYCWCYLLVRGDILTAVVRVGPVGVACGGVVLDSPKEIGFRNKQRVVKKDEALEEEP